MLALIEICKKNHWINECARKNLVKIPLGSRDIRSFWWDVEEFTFFKNNYKFLLNDI